MPRHRSSYVADLGHDVCLLQAGEARRVSQRQVLPGNASERIRIAKQRFRLRAPVVGEVGDSESVKAVEYRAAIAPVFQFAPRLDDHMIDSIAGEVDHEFCHKHSSGGDLTNSASASR